MMNDEEVDEFGGLESSVTQAEDTRMGVEEQPTPQADKDPPTAAAPASEDPAASDVPSQVAGSC
jgi:hypothetical protein